MSQFNIKYTRKNKHVLDFEGWEGITFLLLVLLGPDHLFLLALLKGSFLT